MKLSANFLVVLLLFLLVTSCKDTPKPVLDSGKSDYALYDANGRFHRFSTYNNKKAIVLWVQGNGCPIVRNGLTDFNTIAKDYSAKGFQFFMINSNMQDDRAEISSEAKKFNFTTPVLVDNAQFLADELDINTTAEAIVLHPVSRKILFRGPINNRLGFESQKDSPSETYLKNALENILNGEETTTSTQVTRGCTVTRRSKKPNLPALTYTKDIAPILQSKCVSCHRTDGMAPWTMDDYQTVAGWSAMIKEVILSKRMPPWKVDPTIGDFKNSYALADSNARKIIQWIDAGLPSGNGDDPLQNTMLPIETWERGTPDKTIVLNQQTIPADKQIPYRYQTFDLELDKDEWLKGVEIVPGNTKVLHHVVLTNTKKYTTSPITDRKQHPFTDNYIALGAGPNQTTFFPEDTGIFLPRGTKLTVQLHYTPMGKETTDITKIGFYFLEKAPKKEFYSLSPSNYNFIIPPHTDNIKITAADTISKDIYLHYILPHMHYRGKQIKVVLTKPSGEKKTLISVPDYSIDWQWLYQFKEPIFAPKGSVILVEGIYDNTVQNPLNPDPSKEIKFGIQSTDEMLMGFFNYTLAK